MMIPHSPNVGMGAVTSRVAEALPLFPASDVRSPDVLTSIPISLPLTSIEIVQVAPAPTLPPVYEITLLPVTAVRVPPEHDDTSLGGLATTIPTGKLSVKSRLNAATADPELSIEKVNVVVPPCGIMAGLKLLLNAGGGGINLTN